MERDMETMLAVHAGISVILSSLIATHPNYHQFQIHLSGLMEIAELGSLGRSLNDRQREVARHYVESLQQIKEVRGEIDPLANLTKKSI